MYIFRCDKNSKLTVPRSVTPSWVNTKAHDKHLKTNDKNNCERSHRKTMN